MKNEPLHTDYFYIICVCNANVNNPNKAKITETNIKPITEKNDTNHITNRYKNVLYG